MTDREPIPLNLVGDAAALVESESIIESCSPAQVVGKALKLYGLVAPELRNGGRLIVEVDTTNDTTANRRGLGKLVTKFADMLDGHSGRTLSRYTVSFPEDPKD